MLKPLLILLGLAGILRAEASVVTNAPADAAANAVVPTPTPPPELSWTNVPKDCWGEKALPYAQAGLKVWYRETDPKKKEEIGEKVLELANKADATDIGLELFAGKSVAQAELPVPTNAVAMPLTAIKEWDLTRNEYDTADACVIRRIGPKNFELWTPKSGWLFDEKGKVLAEAKVSRRDGTGRQWYGAFLPDGQWITTDLWERDDRIYLFSKENKLLNSFSVGTIAAWARADMSGSRWVVGIVDMNSTQNYGWGLSYHDFIVSPWGWRQRVGHWLKKLHLPVPASWKFVQQVETARALVAPRDLGSRGWFIDMGADSDDRKASISWNQPGHGPWVGWPRYSMQSHDHSWEMCIPENRGFEGKSNFGFFPASLTSWVGGDKYPIRPTHDYETFNEEFRRAHYYDRDFQSWIITPDGKALGWLPAERVGDDPDGQRMWFVDEQGCLLKVSPDCVVSEVLQPTLPGSTGNDAPFAHVLFPDLKLGFFYTKPGHLVLARWN